MSNLVFKAECKAERLNNQLTPVLSLCYCMCIYLCLHADGGTHVWVCIHVFAHLSGGQRLLLDVFLHLSTLFTKASLSFEHRATELG